MGRLHGQRCKCFHRPSAGCCLANDRRVTALKLAPALVVAAQPRLDSALQQVRVGREWQLGIQWVGHMLDALDVVCCVKGVR